MYNNRYWNERNNNFTIGSILEKKMPNIRKYFNFNSLRLEKEQEIIKE